MAVKRIIVGAIGIILTKEGEYLVTRRVDYHQETNHKWQLPGGALEFGETPEQAALREIYEEVGVRAKVICKQPIVTTQTWDLRDKHSHVVLISYLMDIGSQKIRLNNEADDFRFVTSANLDYEQSLPATKSILETADILVKQYNLLESLFLDNH